MSAAIAIGRGPASSLSCRELTTREVNRRLQAAAAGQSFVIEAPAGRHALAAGLREAVGVRIAGHVGYYCAGMNQAASVRIEGNAGVGVAENMMSGEVHVTGSAGQSAAASAQGGRLVVRGNAAARCAIALKGADVVVCGSVGHGSAFMAQSGRLLICGDAGEGLGDSLYETRIYLAGTAASLGADCVEKPMRDEHRTEVASLLAAAGVAAPPSEFRRYGSARRLYHFDPEEHP